MRYAVAKMFKMVLSHCYVVAIVLWVVARAVKQLPKGFNFFTALLCDAKEYYAVACVYGIRIAKWLPWCSGWLLRQYYGV